jgi:hypothetical protein
MRFIVSPCRINEDFSRRLGQRLVRQRRGERFAKHLPRVTKKTRLGGGQAAGRGGEVVSSPEIAG